MIFSTWAIFTQVLCPVYPRQKKVCDVFKPITFFLKFTTHVSKILCLKWVKTQSQPCLGSLCCSCLLWFSHSQMRFVMMYKVKTISGLWLFLSVWLWSAALECTLYNPLKLKALLNCWRYASWHQVCNSCRLTSRNKLCCFQTCRSDTIRSWYHRYVLSLKTYRIQRPCFTYANDTLPGLSKKRKLHLSYECCCNLMQNTWSICFPLSFFLASSSIQHGN